MDILGSGGFLISNYQPELAEYFIPDIDFVYYDNIEDAISKSNFYLKKQDLRSQIALNGHHKVSALFTYDIQLQKLFEITDIS